MNLVPFFAAGQVRCAALHTLWVWRTVLHVVLRAYGQPCGPCMDSQKAKTEIYFRHCCYDSGPNSSYYYYYYYYYLLAVIKLMITDTLCGVSCDPKPSSCCTLLSLITERFALNSGSKAFKRPTRQSTAEKVWLTFVEKLANFIELYNDYNERTELLCLWILLISSFLLFSIFISAFSPFFPSKHVRNQPANDP